MNKTAKLLTVLTAALGALVLGGCKEKPAAGTSLKPFQILLDWQPEPTYLGVYYAREKGYYRELGLDVEIVPSWGANQAVAAVAGGKYAIATASGGATVLGYNNEAKCVSLAVLYPRIPTVVYGLSDKKLATPQDLIGKKVGIYPGSINVNEFDAFMKANNVDKSQLTIVSLSGSDIALLRSGQIDFGLHYWEMSPTVVDVDPQVPQVEGRRTSFLKLADYGVRGYGVNIISSRETLAKQGDLVKKVAEAMVRGYTEAKKNPDEAAAVYSRLFPDRDPAFVKESLRRVNEMLGSPMGAQDREGWQQTIDSYDSLGLLKVKPSPTDILP